MKILIVDDDLDVAEALTLTFDLLRPHYAVLEAHDGETAIETFTRESSDLVVLDIVLPQMDGYEVLRRIRQTSDVPVIMLTVKEEERDKVKALGMGADDYIVKPFHVLELLARIRAIQRRRVVQPRIAEAAPLVCGDLRIDFLERKVTVAGRPAKLTPTEYGLLVCLARNAGQVVSARTLLTRVWGPEYVERVSRVKMCVQRLRAKLEKDPSRPTYILTERGAGYRLELPN
jgi:two-component system KDP operon response regulator KdpE